MRARIGAIVLCTTLLAGPAAVAQDVALPEPALPTTPSQKGNEPEVAITPDQQIDLSNIVTSAAKGVTTVQEAPAIINVITADEIKRRGWKWMDEALSTVPGWIETSALGAQTQNMLVRGVSQAAMIMHDGISLFDNYLNTTPINRSIPLESVKRIEAVTGPGGVLWGANSFMGLVNIITKDGDDVNGIEAGAQYGDGRGNVEDARGYVMYGKAFFHDRLKIFQHISYENYQGPNWNLPLFIASPPGPQPAGVAFYGAVQDNPAPRSWLLTIDGKYQYGPVSLYYAAPFGESHAQLTFGQANVPHARLDQYDRYAILEYKDRFFHDHFGINTKAYYTDMERNWQFDLYPTSSLFPPSSYRGVASDGGLYFKSTSGGSAQRTGLTLDTDIDLSHGIKLLAGGEFFYEWAPETATTYPSPVNPADLPLYCPIDASGMPIPNCPRLYTTLESRYVGALYVDAQWHPLQPLIFDGGVRLQQGFGAQPYDLTPLYSGSLVWSFLPNFHFKANYSTGFRTSVANATNGAPGGVGYASNPNLNNERSQSFEGELNARLLRNVKKIRELELRADYSYTVLSDLIQLQNYIYGNTGKRAIHSVEAQGRLYFAGDHYLTASYTYLYAITADRGLLRAQPNQWFTLGASFSVIRRVLELNANLNVFGASEDPNRYPSLETPIPGATTGAKTTDLTFDRLTPVALLQLGAHAHLFRGKVTVSAQFFNVLDQHYWYMDPFYDLVPATEMTPDPAPGFNFYASVSYHP